MISEKIIQIDTALDHLSGEEIGHALTALNGLPEVLDAMYLTGIGKKNRPAGLLQILCKPEHEELVTREVFRHTHTLGLRRSEIERIVLSRKESETMIAGRSLASKSYSLENRDYTRPEADALARLAGELGVGTPALRFGKNKF